MHIRIVAPGLAGALVVGWWLAGSLAPVAAAGQAAGPVREIAVVAERFKFVPDRIEVTQGERVRLNVRSADGTHGLAIKKLKVDLSVPKGGRVVSVEFDASQAGEFAITCSEYCGRGHSAMTGVLVVRPAGGVH